LKQQTVWTSSSASLSLPPCRTRSVVQPATTTRLSSCTAPSTQPPETLPTALPSGPTSMVAPGGRGALRQVPTTVAIPTGWSVRHQPSSSSITSRTAYHLTLGHHRRPGALAADRTDRGDQLIQRGEVVGADHGVAVRPGRGHAAGERLVPRTGGTRVGPDDPVRQAGQAPHLGAQHRRVTGVPSVGYDHHHRATGHPPGAVGLHELPQTL